MKKILTFGAAAVAALAFTGCRMCSEPIIGDPTCIENSHYSNVRVRPNAVTLSKPNFAGSREVFRPVFKAGTKRISVTGEGTSRKNAMNDAVAKFLAKADCDYIVAVNTVTTKKTHPTWRLFATSNYTVVLSGIPVHLEKLSCETISEEKAEKLAKFTEDDGDDEGGVSFAPSLTINLPNVPTDSTKDSTPAPAACDCSPAMLKLSDIRVSISANGSTDDKAGIVFPVK